MSDTVKLPKLYTRTSKGVLQEWEIEVHKDGKFRTNEGLVGMKISTNEWNICESKNLGKKNETSAFAQAMKEAKSKWDKKCKTGYSEDVDEAGITEYIKPMLAESLKDYPEMLVFPVLVQKKLNGNRNTTSLQYGMHTRKGEKYYMKNSPHVWEALKPFYAKYPDACVDGELFNDSLKEELNKLSEIVGKKADHEITPALLQKSRQIVQFHVYDGYGFEGLEKDAPYIERIQKLEELLDKLCPDFNDIIHMVETVEVNNRAELDKFYLDYVAEGGEGAIIRFKNNDYLNKRSKYLLKYKPEDDHEFEIVDIITGDGNWSGKAKEMIFKDSENFLGLGSDKEFGGSFKGKMPVAAKVLKERHKYIGKKVTVHYNGLTGKGVPNYARWKFDNSLKVDK